MNKERVFLSFLGLGRSKKDAAGQVIDQLYDETEYIFVGQSNVRSRYVQSAILQGTDEFDRVILAMTPQSKAWHWDRPERLKAELEDAGLNTDQFVTVEISEVLTVAEQWENFGKLVLEVPAGARLCVDLTHGFRIIPVLFSVAIEMLTRIKDVQLEAVWYGAYEPAVNPDITQVVDVSLFFGVTRWAEAVRAVTEDLNPSMLAMLASDDRSELRIPGLARPGLADSMSRLAATVKNANANGAPEDIMAALDEINAAHADASALGRALLELMLDKFGAMSHAESARRFTRDWYETQLTLGRLMVDHGLLMQGLTVHQELLTSCFEEMCTRAWYHEGCPERLLCSENKSSSKAKAFAKSNLRSMGDSLRARVSLKSTETYDPSAPRWDSEHQYMKPLVLRVFEESLRFGYDSGRFEFFAELTNLRNSFNHGWMGKKAMGASEVTGLARELDLKVSTLVRELLQEGLIGQEHLCRPAY